MPPPIDFSDDEIEQIRTVITKRYQKDIELHLADSELQLNTNTTELISCPTIFWHARNCNFVVLKTATNIYRGQFFYTPEEHYSTIIDEYNDVTECVVTILQLQSDNERERAGVNSTTD